MSNRIIKICILYPTDPAGNIIGGIESFIRGLIKAAPDYIQYNVIGATTDPVNRPVAKWTECKMGNNVFNYYPVYSLSDSQKRTIIPATFMHLVASEFRLPDLSQFDVIESHRIEHFISARSCNKPMSLFLHNTMDIVKNKASDIRWKWMPGLYFWLEKKAISKIDSMFIVREDGARMYKEKYPEKKDVIEFIPTVVDTDLFYPISYSQKITQREKLIGSMGVSSDEIVLSFVGRLDSSKDPELLLNAFSCLSSIRNDVKILLIGDGVLRSKLEAMVLSMGLTGKVLFLGFKTSSEVASILQVSDLFLLTSAYEGMPIALTEAMSCGLPAITTNVGEVRKLIEPGVNGEICESRSPEEFSELINKVCSHLAQYSGEPCTRAAEPYSPDKVFSVVYKTYERLSHNNV